MSNGNIEQFLEVFVSYTALSPNSLKVVEEEQDGTMVRKALVKIPVLVAIPKFLITLFIL